MDGGRNQRGIKRNKEERGEEEFRPKEGLEKEV